MRILDHLVSALDPTNTGDGGFLRRHVRAGTKLLEHGQRTTARITGIRVIAGTEDTPERHEYRLEFAGPGAAVVVAGCRQHLTQVIDDVRLGMELPVRFDDQGRVIVDTPGLGGDAWGYRALAEPPEPGIDDPGLGLDRARRKARAARVTILGARRGKLLGALGSGVDLQVRVEPADGPAFETTLKRERVPFYAGHLLEAGTALPGLSRAGRTDKVRIDWPAAAMADPGVGRPAAPVEGVDPETDRVATASGAQDWSRDALAADDHGEAGGVPFQTWVQVQAGLVRDRVKPTEHDAYAQAHGVPAGGWAAAQAAWHQRMRSDPRVGAAFGAAYQAALKGR